MKVLCIGGAGKIGSEAVLDLVATSDFKKITIADINEEVGKQLIAKINDPRVDFIKIDVNQEQETIELMKKYDIVANSGAGSISDVVIECVAKARVNGINLSGMIDEGWKYNKDFEDNGNIMIPGFGMTPGITNIMAKYAYDRLDTVDEAYISHGSFRPVAYSPGIANTTKWEYDPDTRRLVFEDGEFVQVLPFARPRTIELPDPYGTHPQYIIPHPETLTLSKSMADKGIRLVEVRGTWPPKNMHLIKTLYDWGILRNPEVEINGTKVGVWDVLATYLLQSDEGTKTELYGYALHVEITGTKDGQNVRYILTNTHPASDGSVKEWEGLRSYTKCVGIPLSIGAQLIAKGKAKGVGIVAPELAFDPVEVFKELQKRDIMVQKKVFMEGAVN